MPDDIKKIEIIFDPNKYPNCTEKYRVLKVIKDIEEGNYWQRLKELDYKTGEIQKTCDCSQYPQIIITEKNPDYNSWSKSGSESLQIFFSGNQCSECKKIIHRKKGICYDVCYRCGNDMKSVGIVSGQGGREHHYECSSKNCFHTEWHT
jgi:hypothetical protein